MNRFPLLGLLLAPVAVALTFPTHAQPARYSQVQSAPDPSARPPRATTLKARTGTTRAQALLGSPYAADRMRGIERLGSFGSPPALELLVKWLDGGGANDSQMRLVAVRALAPHARQASVQQALVRIMTGVGSTASKGDPMEPMVRSSAALALARSREAGAVRLLAKALRQEGPTAEVAAAALRAYPPVDLTPLIDARGAPTRSLVTLLGQLGDQRGFHPLRAFVRWAQPDVRAEAAVALTELGDLETVELARHWLKHEKSVPLRVAATRILAIARTADAPTAVARLLTEPETQAAGLELAVSSPHPKLVPTLAKLLDPPQGTDAALVLGAIGRAGGSQAARLLARQLTRPELAKAAAYALALSAGDAATEQLELALRSAKTRRLAALASVVRERALGAEVAGTRDTLGALLTSRGDAADRSAGAWGLAVLEPSRLGSMLASKDPVVVRAAARAALAAGATTIAATRLAHESDVDVRTALCIGLATLEGADQVPTQTLLEMVEQGGACAPLAARALAARDSEELRPRVEAVLAGSDALFRAHAALGLAHSPLPNAVGLLDSTYRLDADPSVRHAVVVALSQRSEPTRVRTLRLAASLDADIDVREAARIALAGQRLAEFVSGPGSFWLDVGPDLQSGTTPRATALLELPTGLAIPLPVGPDGLAIAVGLPVGQVRVRMVVEQKPPRGIRPAARMGKQHGRTEKTQPHQ